jgi:hypothetical protein
MRFNRHGNPGADTPIEVRLVFRYIPTRRPGAEAATPRGPTVEQPFARWYPGGSRAPGFLPLEGYDPVARRFVPLPVVTSP